MATEIVMPRLSDSMEEGTILRWLKGDGEAVSAGEEFVEIETDKASMTHEADADGILHHVAGEGDTLAVGAVIAQLLGEGESPPAAGPAERARDAEPALAPAPAPASTPANGAAAPAPAASLPANGAAAPMPAASRRPRSSPLARRVAQDLGVDLAAVAGSGPGGRVVRRDVEQASESAAAPAASVPEPAAAGADRARGQTTIVELSRIQRTVARRMAESRATVPHFSVEAEVDMGPAAALREELRALGREPLPSLNDMIVRACALALREFPRANGSYRDGQFELHERINIGVAVAAEDALVVPTVFDADRRTLGDTAAEVRRLAARVREGTVTPPELGGGTFTVSNLGMYGTDRFEAVINPPQAAILAVGAARERAVVRDGVLTVGRTGWLTLSSDHRILYGADAAQLLARIRELLESPLALLV